MGTAKKLRSNKGFTLVELVVVIAVLAILAGVGTVAYRGYITKANEAAVYTKLDALKTALDATVAAEAVKTSPVVEAYKRLDVSIGTGMTIKVSNDEAQEGTKDLATDLAGTDFKIFYTDGDIILDGYVGATWTATNGWTLTKSN